jgi:hypothetical protein
MKKYAALLFLIILFGAGCKNSKSDIYTVPDYKDWKKPVPEVLNYPVPAHGTENRVIYGNDLAFKVGYTLNNGRKIYRFPDGAVIIKENFAPEDTELKGKPDLTIMVKDSAGEGALDGWHYYMKHGDEPAMPVRNKMCIDCHSAANESFPYFDKNPDEDFRDYIFAPFF